MEKIPTLFKRDPENMKHVLPEVNPGCEWVLAGEGQATRKYDGTCVMFDGERWWARREVKPGKQPPENFQPISTDENTGKTVGWEPVEQSGFARWHAEAVHMQAGAISGTYEPGTYELCGPKVQGDPEGFEHHTLVRHATADVWTVRPPLTFERIRDAVIGMGEAGLEGIVWHHPDGRMAKLKARDFPREFAAASGGTQGP